MKYTIITAICLLIACFAINSAKNGLDTIKATKTAQNQVLAMVDK